MNMPRLIVFLCIFLIALIPVARAASPDAKPKPPASTDAAKAQADTEMAKSLGLPDPNEKNLTGEERLARQKTVIMRRIEMREKAKAEEAKKNGKVTEIGPKSPSAEPTAIATVMNLLLELRGEVKEIHAAVHTLTGKPGAPQPAAQPKPSRTCRLELELTFQGNKSLKIVGFGGEKFEINSPLFNRTAEGETKGVGSFQFTATLDPAATGNTMQLDFHVLMSIPVVQKNGQSTFDSGTMGKTTIKFGEAKEIWRVDENSIKLTLKPE